MTGVMEIISRGVFGIASAVLMLIALALSVYSASLIVTAMRGPVERRRPRAARAPSAMW